MPWASGSIASFSVAIVVICWMSLNVTLPIAATASTFSPSLATLLPSTHVAGETAAADYQPPDNGGPDESGGAGTRCQ